MAAFLFPDNQDRLFGREADVAYLVARAKTPGLTILHARPQLGKTWTLYEAGRRLVAEGVIVGYFENPGGASDMLKRAVADALTRWVEGANFAEQAKALGPWLQSEAVIKTGLLVGNLVPALAKVTGALPDAVTGVIGKVFEGFADAQTQLKTGGLVLQPLEYEQARDIVRMVAGISKKPVVLILDAWEKSADLDIARGILETFLGHCGDWQPCHILLGVRDPDPANPETSEKAARATDHLAGCSGLAEKYQLQPMNLDDPAEQRRMLSGIRREVSGAKNLEDLALLSEVEGFPGVLMRWRQKQPDSAEGFTESAVQAREYVYGEFTPALADSLLDTAFQFAMRVTLMPRLTPDTWKLFRPVIEDGISEPRQAFDELKRLHVLDRELYPTFGHDTRYAAAKTWLVEAKRLDTAEEIQGLIGRLAGFIRKVDATDAPYSYTIIGMASANKPQYFDPVSTALASAALSLLYPRSIVHMNPEWVREAVTRYPNTAPLLAMGLVNALNDKRDPSRSSDLLSELRSLADHYPEGAAIRERLAKGLVNVLYDEADPSRRRDLLSELRSLADHYPDEAAIRKQLADGLFNALTAEPDPSGRSDLLSESRSLAVRYPDDAAIREVLAQGLFNAFHDEPDPSGRNDLLSELRSLADGYPDQAAIREPLTRGLFNAFNLESNPFRRRDLLSELQSLADRYPDEAAIRDRLAKGLAHGLSDELDLSRRGDLLSALRSLADRYPNEMPLRESLTNGLFNALYDERDPSRRSDLLSELRSLADSHRDEMAIQEGLAKGLFNAVFTEADPARQEAMWAELWEAAERLPPESEVRRRVEALADDQARP